MVSALSTGEPPMNSTQWYAVTGPELDGSGGDQSSRILEYEFTWRSQGTPGRAGGEPPEATVIAAERELVSESPHGGRPVPARSLPLQVCGTRNVSRVSSSMSRVG